MDKFNTYIDTNDKKLSKSFVIALAGNPNVGKSTVFNNLTGLKQHTGNWSGKTVANANGKCHYNEKEYLIVDLPGTYSLTPLSREEEHARDFIINGNADAVIVVADATNLERNLLLFFQILEVTDKVVLAVNLIDEAQKKGISVDCKKLADMLSVPVVPLTATHKKEVLPLLNAAETASENKFALKIIYDKSIDSEEKAKVFSSFTEKLVAKVVVFEKNQPHARDRKIDKVLTSRIFGIPIMLCLLGVIFYITISLANYPTQWLFMLFEFLGKNLNALFTKVNAPFWLQQPLMGGIYTTTTWVIAVMLPPMAIFFPLFTLLEDLGYLPRIAFNLDRPFAKSGCSGKQSLTMCMGFGCNACGVTGTRIIDSPRERLIAILTNNFVPCNGRFPILITISTFFIGGTVANVFLQGLISTLSLTLLILFGIMATFLVSLLLSKTFLKGTPSSFILELPPYRKPQIRKILIRSLLDRTIFVLGRAIAVAAPAGLVIWCLANLNINSQPIIYYIATFLQPLGALMGLDGYILTAFILGFPANEIVTPIIVMSYTSSGILTDITNINELGALLIANGWTITTGISLLLFTLLHFPCATTMWTIAKETKSVKWTTLAFILPTIIGIVVCMIFTAIVGLF